jgi:hypothetical protein
MTNFQEIADKWNSVSEMKPFYIELNKIRNIFCNSIEKKHISKIFDHTPQSGRWRSINNIYLTTYNHGTNWIMNYLITPFGKSDFGNTDFDEMVKATKKFMDNITQDYNIIELDDIDCYEYHWFEGSKPYELGPISFKTISFQNFGKDNVVERIYKLIPLKKDLHYKNDNDRIFDDVDLPDKYELLHELLDKLKQ